MQNRKVSSKEIVVQEFKRLTADRNYLVTWYGGLRKNNVAGSVPNVVVFLRKLDDNYNPNGWLQVNLALTHLGVLRIGSIWRDGELRSQQVLPSEIFSVDFTPDKWQFITPENELAASKPNPINPNDYELQYKADKNWLINFPLPKSKNLLIPCLEFFCRCYGASLEVNRVLATYPWYEVEHRLYDPSYGSNTSGGWHIKLRHRMHKNDVVLLAHLKYDLDAQRKAKSIYAQLETLYRPDKNLMFPRIGPWFEDKAEIQVEGHWINGGKTFLALRVTGCSDPSGEKIYRTREQSIKDIESNASLDGSDTTTFPVQRFAPGPIIDVTTAEEPDNPSDWLSVQGDDFLVLGKPRTVIDKKTDGDPDKRRIIPTPGDDPISKVSAGEAYGKGKGTGSAIAFEQRVLESHGMVRDMWNALLKAKEAHPEIVTSVQWYTFKDGFNSGTEPKCIALAPVDPSHEEKYNFPKDAKNWVYVESEITRGILVICIGAIVMTEAGVPQKKRVYIIEIERRIRSAKSDAPWDITEENLRGIVFTLKDNRKLDETLSQFMFNVRRVKGVVHRLTGKFPDKAYAFKHTPSKDDQFPCERTVKSALAKVGVKVG